MARLAAATITTTRVQSWATEPAKSGDTVCGRRVRPSRRRCRPRAPAAPGHRPRAGNRARPQPGRHVAPRVAAAEPFVARLVILAGGTQPLHWAAVRQVRYLASLDP